MKNVGVHIQNKIRFYHELNKRFPLDKIKDFILENQGFLHILQDNSLIIGGNFS